MLSNYISIQSWRNRNRIGSVVETTTICFHSDQLNLVLHLNEFSVYHFSQSNLSFDNIFHCTVCAALTVHHTLSSIVKTLICIMVMVVWHSHASVSMMKHAVIPCVYLHGIFAFQSDISEWIDMVVMSH